MRLNESKYFFNVTLCLSPSLSADDARGKKRETEKIETEGKREEDGRRKN
jgi:hypothetical protein